MVSSIHPTRSYHIGLAARSVLAGTTRQDTECLGSMLARFYYLG